MAILNKYFLFGIAICMSFNGHTQQDSLRDSSSTLPLVDVLAKYNREHIADLSSATPRFIINHDKIKALGTPDIGSAMKYVPGVQMRDYGGIGGIKTISFRSLGGAHTAVSLDHALMLNAQTGVINLSAFETFGLESLTFSTGQPNSCQAVASAYIPAQLLAVNAELMHPDTSLLLRAYQNLTSINAFESGVLLSSPLGKKGFIGTQFFSRYGSGAYDYVYALDGSDEVRSRSNSELFNIKGRLTGGYRWETAKIAASVIYRQQDQQLPGAVILYNPSNDQQLEQENLRGDLQFFKHWNNWRLKTHAYVASDYTFYHDPSFLNMEGFIRSEYDQTQSGGGFMLNYVRPASTNRIFIGSDVNAAELISSEFMHSPSRTSINSVVGSEWQFGKLSLQAHLNHQQIVDQTNTSDGEQSAVYSKLSPFLSLAYLPLARHALQFRTHYKRVFRMPTFNDLYYNFIGNTGLRPEDAHLFNLGVTYGNKASNKRLKVECNMDGFYNLVANKIVAVPTKDLFNWSMQNIGKTQAIGIDAGFTLSQQINHWNWVLAANATYNEVTDQTNENSPSFGHQIPYTPKFTANTSFHVGFKGYQLVSNAIYSGERYSLNENIPLNYLAPFLDWNVGVQKAFQLGKSQLLDVNFKVMNLLNKNYEVIRSFPMPGRYLQLTIRYSLQ